MLGNGRVGARWKISEPRLTAGSRASAALGSGVTVIAVDQVLGGDVTGQGGNQVMGQHQRERSGGGQQHRWRHGRRPAQPQRTVARRPADAR